MVSLVSRRALAGLASRSRSAFKCCRSSIAQGESGFGSARGYVPSCAPSSSFSANSAQGSRRFSVYLSRLPKELACVQSLLPLHSVTAAARLVSHLSSSAGEAPAILHDLSSLKPR